MIGTLPRQLLVGALAWLLIGAIGQSYVAGSALAYQQMPALAVPHVESGVRCADRVGNSDRLGESASSLCGELRISQKGVRTEAGAHRLR